MKGQISLADFISEVKKELVEAVKNKKEDDDPFFTLNAVELQTEFGLKAEASGGFKFFVDLSAKTEANQRHCVTLKFSPIRQSINPSLLSGGGGNSITAHGDITVSTPEQAVAIRQYLQAHPEVIDPDGINFHVVTMPVAGKLEGEA
ncbi:MULTISPECIES: trypco2 family protein [Pseudoalteromonas]|uniref:Trypsin-co-occurring domain-containing protein n=1 Tax=Pseudoalteromonas piscicida TaxID=43662 RepID=A0ABN5CJT4_PSEO7|nr:MULTISPECIES: trypco2 family protein [Pseudoalteromonas]ATD07276.1 hypothetical protein PPIS_a2288 [Pseudoalteromonas piscicida]MCO7197862.1 hypothetical protein [Pseudoalteromonas sp. OANN1]WPU33925.1 trypco2 family protein [Pseudoalteromonas piscicida]